MTSGGEAPTFYPAVWHGIATVIYQVTGISVPATANLMSVLVGAVIWPLSVMYLVRSTMRASVPALLSVGVIRIVHGVPHAAHQLRCALPQ